MKNLFLAIMMTAFSVNVLAHGEDKPGPNGGFIKMPANFHTEVVPEEDGSFRVYLLDINFQNPVVKKSDVKAWIKNGKKKKSIHCHVMGSDHFHCMPGKVELKGKLILKVNRDGVKAGVDAIYDLPFKLAAAPATTATQSSSTDSSKKAPPASKEDHSHHH